MDHPNERSLKAAIDAGADTVMCSFNAINGVPGCANFELETQLLKGEWGFDGFIESDYTAVAELRACPPKLPDSGPCGHGVAADGPDAAQAALNAGTDSEMVSTNIRDNGAQLLSQHRITMARINDAVRRILRVKFRAGLFDHPYVDQAKAVAPSSFLADRPPVRCRLEVQLALPRHRLVRPALRVWLRPQLHHVLGHEPAAELAQRVQERQRHGVG